MHPGVRLPFAFTITTWTLRGRDDGTRNASPVGRQPTRIGRRPPSDQLLLEASEEREWAWQSNVCPLSAQMRSSRIGAHSASSCRRRRSRGLRRRIKSAVKAHESKLELGSRELRSNYNEPGSRFVSAAQHHTGSMWVRSCSISIVEKAHAKSIIFVLTFPVFLSNQFDMSFPALFFKQDVS